MVKTLVDRLKELETLKETATPEQILELERELAEVLENLKAFALPHGVRSERLKEAYLKKRKDGTEKIYIDRGE